VIITIPDCGTEHGLWVEREAVSEEEFRLRVFGRVLAADLVNADGEILARRGTIITDTIDEDTEGDAILITDVMASTAPKLKVRTVMDCRATYGVCQACYGRNLASGKLVDLGDAVGIIAAQSIGEPGTQLTMRTFHTGGVARADITSGLPRVEELFEARVPKGASLLADREGVISIQQTDTGRILAITSTEIDQRIYRLEQGWEPALAPGAVVVKDKTVLAVGPNEEKLVSEIDGVFLPDGRTLYVRNEKEERAEHPVPVAYQIFVEDGDLVRPGQQLTDGTKDPQQILLTQGRDEVQRYIIDEVQKVYRSQGVNTNDKHIEVICRQMLRKVSITYPGDTDYLQDERIDRFEFNQINEEILAQGGEPATGIPVLLGITKASLETDSFLSAASFQETTRVLTEAAINGKVDSLRGLKENVIIGKLIPAGSGFGVTPTIELPIHEELALEAITQAAEPAESEDYKELMETGFLPVEGNGDAPVAEGDEGDLGALSAMLGAGEQEEKPKAKRASRAKAKPEPEVEVDDFAGEGEGDA
jgi:DNA-directed RNA polymerase subunit beta'